MDDVQLIESKKSTILSPSCLNHVSAGMEIDATQPRRDEPD